jgi:hypothetical protein
MSEDNSSTIIQPLCSFREFGFDKMSVLIGVLVSVVAGAFMFPFSLGALGFSAVGPVAGSVASWGIGGLGGGAAFGFATLQSIAMIPFTAATYGAIGGAVVGVVGSIVALIV